MTITLNINCLLELVKAALLVVRFVSLSVVDYLWLNFRYPITFWARMMLCPGLSVTPQMTKIVKIAKMAKSTIQRTKDICYKCSHLRNTRSRESIDWENTDAREGHKIIITMRRIMTTLWFGRWRISWTRTWCWRLIYSFGPMHLLHIDVGQLKKRNLSIDQQMVGANRTLNILYWYFHINNRRIVISWRIHFIIMCLCIRTLVSSKDSAVNQARYTRLCGCNTRMPWPSTLHCLHIDHSHQAVSF